MSKAILVINMPERCYDCNYKRDCQDYNNTEIPEACWLNKHKIPRLENKEQVYQMMTKHSAMCNVGTSTKFSMLRFMDGWESCLDEIEGKSR